METLPRFSFTDFKTLHLLSEKLPNKMVGLKKRYTEYLTNTPLEERKKNVHLSINTSTNFIEGKISLLPFSEGLPEEFQKNMTDIFKECCIESGMSLDN